MGLTLIFILDFSVRIKARDLFKSFGCIDEEEVEVAISPRSNKVGKRFGFVRFMQKEDVKMLAVWVWVTFLACSGR